MPEPPRAVVPKSRGRVRSWAVGLLALAMMAWVLHKNGGVDTILTVVRRLTYTWPLLLLPYALNALVTIFAYRTCLPDRGRAVPLRALIQIERSGSALNAILPFGDSSGNIAKVALLRHWYTSDELVAAGVWGSLATGIGNVFAGAGALVAWLVFDVPAWGAGLIAVISLVAGIPASLVLLLVRRGLMRRLAQLVTRLPAALLRSRRAQVLAWADGLDFHLASAVGPRRGDFMRVVGFKLLYQTVRIGELWLVITLLGLPGGLGAALVYNGMSRSVQQLFAFVPGRLGVLELSSSLLFDAMQLPRSFGVQMALTLRFSYVVNLVLAGSALGGAHALAMRYPPRPVEEILSLRAASKAERT